MDAAIEFLFPTVKVILHGAGITAGDSQEGRRVHTSRDSAGT